MGYTVGRSACVVAARLEEGVHRLVQRAFGFAALARRAAVVARDARRSRRLRSTSRRRRPSATAVGPPATSATVLLVSTYSRSRQIQMALN